MFSSVGGWLYEDLAGIGQARSFTKRYNLTDPTAQGFQHAILYPRITDHPNVSWVEGEYTSISGTYAVTWINPNGTGSGSNCVENAPENAPVTLSCPAGGGVFTNVIFASFGTPTGSCGSGFQLGSCNALNSTAIVSAACLNKSTCTIDVADSLFGDPCYETVKQFDALLECSSPTGISVTATVPTNGRATVRIPFPATTPVNGILISEGTSPVFKGGNFVPGVSGVYSAIVSTDDVPAGQMTVDFEVGSGTFAFTST
jgi:hypothetical protein